MTFLPEFIRGSDLLERAFRFATDAHHGPARRGTTNIDHPLEVARLLYEADYPETVVAAGLLHDVVEDTSRSTEDIRRRFGDKVGDLVASLTEDESIEGYARRKAALRASVLEGGSEAAAIFSADKLAALSRALAERVRLPAQTLEHYRQTAQLVGARYPQTALLGELEAALTGYEQQLASSSSDVTPRKP